MKRCCLLLLLSLLSNPTAAASQPDMSPELAGQLMRILSNADADVEQMLSELAALAERRRRPNDRRFIIRERAALLIQEDRLALAKTELLGTLDGQPVTYAPALRFLLGQIYLLEDNVGAALEPLETWAANTQSLDPAGLFLLGYAYVRSEDFAAAAAILEQLLASATVTRPQWIEVLAYVYTQQGDTERAIDLLQRLVAEHPAEQRWWRQLATAYLLIDDVPRGTAGFTIATSLTQLGFADARRLAQLFGYLGMPADGGELLQNAMASLDEPAGYEDQMLLAELWMAAREFDRALDTLRSASLTASDGEPQMVMGQLLLQRELYADASSALQAAVAAYGENTPPLTWYLLAIAELNAGNPAAAEAAIVAFETDKTFAHRAGPLRDYLRSLR